MDFVFGVVLDLIVFLGEPLFYTSVGLLVGWNVLPQPALVKKGYDYTVKTVRGWFSK